MSGAEDAELHVYNSTYTIRDGKIEPQHLMTAEQARALEEHYPGSTSLQDAVRDACRDALDERRESLSGDELAEHRERIGRIEEMNEEIVVLLSEIRNTLKTALQES